MASCIRSESAAGSSAGMTSNAATNTVIAAAVCRRMAPIPKPSSPIATG